MMSKPTSKYITCCTTPIIRYVFEFCNSYFNLVLIVSFFGRTEEEIAVMFSSANIISVLNIYHVFANTVQNKPN